MTNRNLKKTLQASFILLAASCSQLVLATYSPVIINENAGWCWFQDERAIIADGQLYVGSVASKLGYQGEQRSGNIEVAQFDLSRRQKSAKVTVLHDGLEDDDHNVPALLALPNKSIVAIYSKHNMDKNIRLRQLSSPNDTWQPEQILSRKDKITYANLYRLSEENNGQGRLYNFYRGIDFNPTFDTSDDNGLNWSKGTHFIANKGRPYVKYISNDKNEIHFVTTEQHPRVFNNSIYHGILRGGKIFNSHGEEVHDLKNGPVTTSQLTRVYQGTKDKVAWTIDLHLDENNNPYTVFSVQMNDGNKNRNKGQRHGEDMRYHFAELNQPRWWQFGVDATWQVSEISYAGSRLYDREQDYTGLAALDPNNKSTIVISTNADPDTGAPLVSSIDGKRHWELYKGVRIQPNEWVWTAITQNSIVDNLRPAIPMNNETDDLHLLWMQGRYSSYTEFDTKIMLFTNP